MNATVGDDVQRQVQTIPDELKIIQLKCEELDLRTRAEERRRQVWEECLEDRMRGADWNTYTQELAAASQEIQAWRLNIEDERANFVTLLKSELQDTLLQHIDQKFDQKYEIMNVLPDRVVELTSAFDTQPLELRPQDAGEEIKRLNQRLDQISTALHDEIEGLNAILHNEIKALSTKVAECNVDGKGSDAEASEKQGNADPTVEWTLQQLSMRILELRQDAEAYAMAEDVNKLGEQVKESHPLLFDMGVRLTEIENELEAERETRTAATEDLSRRIDLVGTVFNAGKVEKALKSEKPVVNNTGSDDILVPTETHERHLKLVLEQVDNMAKSQLSAIQEQLEQEQAARKGDVELIWSNLNTMKNRKQVPSLSAVLPTLADRRASLGSEEGVRLSSSPLRSGSYGSSLQAAVGGGYANHFGRD